MKKDKRKARMSLTSFVMAFMFISSWVVLGVALAITSANVNLGGSISFTATDIYADVTGTVTGTATTNTLEDINFSASTKSFTTPTSWSNMTLDFQKDTDIVITVNVKNNSPERSIYIGFTDKITATNTDITRKSAGTTVTAFDTLEVPKSETKTIEITLHVTDQNKAVSGKFDLGLNLSNDEPVETVLDESSYPTLSFNYDDSAKTAIVEANYSNIPTGDLVIPSSVLHNGIEYAVTSVGDFAFSASESLTSVTISEGVTLIGESAFGFCTSLTSINIPSSVTTIGDAAFQDCTSLESITIDAGNTTYYSYENGLYTGTTLFYGCKSTAIKDGTTEIGAGAFYDCTGLTSITIPDSVTTIGYGAFQNCTSLTSVTIGKGVTTIEDNDAFSGCTSIESMIVDKDNTSYYSYENGLYARTTLICGGKNTIIKDGTTTIQSWAFTGCTGLTSITIPSSVTYIGQEAFNGCSKLTSVTFENTTGWKAWASSESETSTILSSADLANKATAATYLTSTYCGTWIRS